MRIRVLLVAYGCSPGSGSEQLTGWQWASALNQLSDLEVTVLTRNSNKARLEEHPDMTGATIIGISDDVAGAQSLPGVMAEIARYLTWCHRAANHLKASEQAKFDVAHHVSWTNIRSNSPAFASGARVVLGPVGGAQLFPRRFSWFMGRASVRELVRNVQVLASRASPVTRRRLASADLIVASNQDTASFARRSGQANVTIMPDIAPSREWPLLGQSHWREDGPLRLLWVGRLLPRKSVGLAIEALATAVQSGHDVSLTVVGDGSDADAVRSAVAKGLPISWLGQVPFEQMEALYRSHHALLFTSLRESGGPPLAEAMQYGLPAIYVSHHGPRTIVDGWGLGVEPTTPKATVQALAARIGEVAADRDALEELATKASEAAHNNLPAVRALMALEWYRAILATKDGTS